mmetsp:Transcript_29384/g.57663  ORF Transcript_29384/g.57663 Transcript_29384/m.57663 type:complete len:462 (+) Transcript_29384:36-1421(+)|eukprot:CAMPEP_0175138100 /NCGR_PEP_ID=MMETSP0087-20121206/10164_1 /TAXON_ID=136419 /ORGANISM="Unknown Unknown, Strain D1" /LENGTH=461 /DNA_ID=CAMNT_0016420971 /DNA_START=35 /DNA_END=1420 /DNA_ORIENTATION=+
MSARSKYNLIHKNSKENLNDGQEIENEHMQVESALNSKVAWHGYEETKTLTAGEAGLLKDYTNQEDAESREDLIDDRGKYLAATFVKAISNIHTNDVRHHLLALVDEMLSAKPERAQFFHQIPEARPYATFLRILNDSTCDAFSVGKASHILSILLCGLEVSRPEVGQFFDWLQSKLYNPQDPLLRKSLMALKGLFMNPAARTQFQKRGGIRSLMSLVSQSANPQDLYLTCFCVWLLSYSNVDNKDESLRELEEHGVIEKFKDILKSVVREKVIRVVFATLRNLIGKRRFNEDMIAHGMVKVIETVSGRKWTDEDLVSDMQVVNRVLEEKLQELSSFEMYAAELDSGNLTWSPVHQESFWRENIKKFEDNNFDMIRRLVLLLDADREECVEVACYDIGEFVRYHPDGKYIITQLKGKDKLMKKMDHVKPEIQKQALLAVQKLMLNNWEILQNGGIASLGSA